MIAALLLAATVSPTIAIARVSDTIDRADDVGSMRAGLLCLPAGRLRWRDVARPDADAIHLGVARALSAAGLGVTVPRDEPGALPAAPVAPDALRLTVTITRLDVRQCVAGMGIGRGPKVAGTVAILWRLFAPDGTPRGSRATAVRIDARGDLRTDPDLLADAVAGEAVAAVRTLIAN